MTATDLALDIARTAAQAASDKKGHDIVGFDVSDQLAITDIFVVISADNDRQVMAIVDEIEDQLLEKGHHIKRREGDRDAQWVLLDYVDVVVHVQLNEARQLYSLERLWRDCPMVDLQIANPEPDQLPDLRAGADIADDAAEFEVSELGVASGDLGVGAGDSSVGVNEAVLDD